MSPLWPLQGVGGGLLCLVVQDFQNRSSEIYLVLLICFMAPKPLFFTNSGD